MLAVECLNGISGVGVNGPFFCNFRSWQVLFSKVG